MSYRLCAFADEADSALSGQIAALKRNGISLLEIRGVDGTNVADLTPEKVKETRDRLTDAGIGVWSIGSPTGKIKITDDFAPHLDSFKRMLETAHVLGATHFRLFSFYEAYDHPAEVIDRMGALCDAAAGSGVTLCHENEKGIYGDEPERIVRLLDALPALRAVFDPANFIQSGVEVLPAWELLRDRTAYLHIKDSRKDGTVVPAGYGEGHFDVILPDYLARGGEVMTLEPHLAEFCGLSDLEQEGDTSVVGSAEFHFENNQEAFDAAVSALRRLLD